MKKQDITLILTLTVILVIAWIIFTILHNISSSTINETLSQQIIPIQPTFDTKTITLLKTRENISPLFTVSTSSATPTIAPTIITPVPLATSSANQASSGGIHL